MRDLKDSEAGLAHAEESLGEEGDAVRDPRQRFPRVQRSELAQLVLKGRAELPSPKDLERKDDLWQAGGQGRERRLLHLPQQLEHRRRYHLERSSGLRD